MYLKKLSPDSPEIAALEQINTEAFPDEERTPIAHLFASDDGHLDILGIYHAEALAGFFVVRVYRGIRYIAYFAIAAMYRSHGLGSEALRLLREYYPDGQMVVETEAPDERCANNPQRIRRQAFYRRNGFQSTGWYLYYDAAELEVLCPETDFRRQDFEELTAYIHTLYYDHVPELYRKITAEKQQ